MAQIVRLEQELQLRDPDLEVVRPATAGEEELQLQIAIALSKEEAQKEDEMRKGDEARYQIAVQESRRDDSIDEPGPSKPATTEDLLGGLGDLGDPWAAQAPLQQPPIPMPTSDPWGGPPEMERNAAPAPVEDPWACLALPAPAPQPGFAAPAANNDPWSPSDTTNGGFDAPLGGGDPWGMDNQELASTPAIQPPGGATRNLKTPENFLGENSNLVNLDNLVGPPRNAAGANPAANPFLMTSGTSPGAPANPFAAQQRPSPTLNQMAASARTPTAAAGQPLDPAPATNPFL